MHRASLAFFVTCALSLSGCWEGITKEVVATILSIRGQVTFSSKGSTNFRPLDSKSGIAPGSIVRTSSDAQIDLSLVPGALARVSGDSELKIEELSITKDGNETGDAMRERVAQVELTQGGLIVLFEGFGRFTIKTRNVTINVLPSCLFRLDVDQSKTRVTCIRGKLYVTPQNGELVAVSGGLFREWPSSNDGMSVTEDQQAQADTTATLEVARQLQELDAGQRNRLPF
jgi:hypothetical protein